MGLGFYLDAACSEGKREEGKKGREGGWERRGRMCPQHSATNRSAKWNVFPENTNWNTIMSRNPSKHFQGQHSLHLVLPGVRQAWGWITSEEWQAPQQTAKIIPYCDMGCCCQNTWLLSMLPQAFPPPETHEKTNKGHTLLSLPKSFSLPRSFHWI